MKSAVDKQERNCFFSSDDSCRLTASPLLIILCFRVCVCVCVACTDTELHSLAARLKDWFGVLHLDANRDLKSSDSFDSATGREYIPHTSVCVCVHACAHVYVQPFFCWAATLFSPHDGCRRCWQRPCSVQGIWTHLSSDTHTHTHTHAHTHIYTHTHTLSLKSKWPGHFLPLQKCSLQPFLSILCFFSLLVSSLLQTLTPASCPFVRTRWAGCSTN